MHGMDRKVANQIAWTLGISTKYNTVARIIQSFLPHSYGGLDILLPSTAFYSHRITQLITYLLRPTQITPPPPTTPIRKRKGENTQTKYPEITLKGLESRGNSSTHQTQPGSKHNPLMLNQCQTPEKQKRKTKIEKSPKIHTPETPAHDKSPQSNKHTDQEERPPQCTTHGWPQGKPAHIIISQLSRLWSGTWKGKQPKTDDPAALPTMHHSASALLALSAHKGVFRNNEEEQLIPKVHPPVRIYPNPLYNPCPGSELKWPYTIPRAEMISGLIPGGAEAKDIIYILSSDGSFYAAEAGKLAKVAYGGVGHIQYQNKIIAYIKYGGRLLSPPSAEPYSSAMGETGGLCEAIRMIPLRIRARIHLDAFAAISSTPTILFETATQRCHRPNRDLWAEIEYLLKLRIQTGAWPIPDMDELRD